MKIFDFLTQPEHQLRNPVVTIGVFDGVHKGHQALLQRTLELADEVGGDPVAITFARHPLEVLMGTRPQSIMSLTKRLELFEHYGMVASGIIEFNKQFAATAPRDFVAQYLVEYLKIRGVVVGDNFRFGSKGSGTPALLGEMGKQHGFKVAIVSCIPLPEEEMVISSTNIRKQVAAGNLGCAREMLGRPFSVVGKVVKGEQRGRTIGFPTANLRLNHDLMPGEGVYIGCSILDETIYPALISIGKTPTFGQGLQLKVEIYLEGFTGDLYDTDVECYIFEQVRSQQVFNNVDELKRQLTKDRQFLLEHIKEHLVPTSEYEQKLFVNVG